MENCQSPECKSGECASLEFYPKLSSGEKSAKAYDVKALVEALKTAGIDLAIGQALKVLAIVAEWIVSKSFDLSELKTKLTSILPDTAEEAARTIYTVIMKWLRDSANVSEHMVDTYLFNLLDLADFNSQILMLIDRIDGKHN